MKTIRKGIAVLDQLSKAEAPLGVTEIATLLTIDKSIVHRILRTFEEAKLVRQDATTKRYSLGIGFLQMGGRFLHQLRLPELAHPHLLRLWERSNETVHLCVRSDLQTVIARVYESKQGVRVSASVGECASLYSTSSGKVFLANGPPELLDQVIALGLTPLLPNTISTGERLRDEIALVRRQGYATDIEESSFNYSAVAVPILGYGGACLAAIAVALPVGRMPSRPNPELLGFLKEAADAISRELPHPA